MFFYSWELANRGRSGGGATPLEFSTSFPNTENPISPSIWSLGQTDGIDWIDPQSTTNKVFAGGLSGTGASLYDDNAAVLKSSVFNNTANQFAEAVVFKQAGYTPTGDHEVELRLRSAINSHTNTGYEILWGIQGSSGLGYMSIVAWKGGLGLFDTLTTISFGGIATPANNDVLYAQIVGTTIIVKVNNSQVLSWPTNSDPTQWSSGQTGIGFYALSGATLANLGFKSFRTGNL